MARRASLLAFSFTLLTSFCFAQFITSPSMRPRDNRFNSRFAEGDSSLDGTVVDAFTNKPLQNARVELRDSANGTVVSSSYTNGAGQFQFGAVPQGQYRIVALMGVSQVEERVDVSSFRTSVNLRMSVNHSQNGDPNGNTISVAQYKIPEKARNEFQKAQEASAKMNLGEARKRVERALEIYPNYADALTLRAVMNLSSNVAASVADLEKAIECDGNYALAYTVLGSALNEQGKFDQALQTLQHGETLAPDSWQTYFEIARSYIGKAQYDIALRELGKAQSLLPAGYPVIMLVSAQAHLGLKQYQNAVSELQAFLQKEPAGPNSGTAHRMLQQAQELMARK
jgi:tetratricopeptide (TPR) repeat protein